MIQTTGYEAVIVETRTIQLKVMNLIAMEPNSGQIFEMSKSSGKQPSICMVMHYIAPVKCSVKDV